MVGSYPSSHGALFLLNATWMEVQTFEQIDSSSNSICPYQKTQTTNTHKEEF